jgi:hypothetical protein
MEPPDAFVCAVTREVMERPVVAVDGHTYEEVAIRAWFAAGKLTSPRTNARLAATTLVPNFALRKAIEEWRSGTIWVALAAQDVHEAEFVLAMRELDLAQEELVVMRAAHEAALARAEALRVQAEATRAYRQAADMRAMAQACALTDALCLTDMLITRAVHSHDNGAIDEATTALCAAIEAELVGTVRKVSTCAYEAMPAWLSRYSMLARMRRNAVPWRA